MVEEAAGVGGIEVDVPIGVVDGSMGAAEEAGGAKVEGGGLEERNKRTSN